MRFSFVAGIAGAALPLGMRGDREAWPDIFEHPSGPSTWEEVPEAPTLKVLTLNLAHGRKAAFHQAFLSGETIEKNLSEVASMLDRERPHVAALQEADGPSVWSGGFDHVRRLAELAEYGWAVRGSHVKGLRLDYGAGLLSTTPLSNAVSRTFAPSPPTPPKGFVVGAMTWPGRPDREFDVVSVHLDFARGSVRASQIREMIDYLASRNRPRIIMGDFNCNWQSSQACLRELAELAGVTPHAPDDAHVRHATHMGAFGSSAQRIDWIFVSPEFEFASYAVLPDVLSDHAPVKAELRWVGE